MRKPQSRVGSTPAKKSDVGRAPAARRSGASRYQVVLVRTLSRHETKREAQAALHRVTLKYSEDMLILMETSR